jgi:hypothetical protein
MPVTPVPTVPPWIEQAQVQADANVLLPWILAQMNSPFSILPEEIKVIIERWIPIYQLLADSNKFTTAVLKWVNDNSGAVPPAA